MADPARRIRIVSNSVATSDSALAMETFDGDTAPKMMTDGPYHCEYKGITFDGEFKNIGENGEPRIQVYELGRLDNVMFKGNQINGAPAKAAYYGKLHAKFAIVDKSQSWWEAITSTNEACT